MKEQEYRLTLEKILGNKYYEEGAKERYWRKLFMQKLESGEIFHAFCEAYKEAEREAIRTREDFASTVIYIHADGEMEVRDRSCEYSESPDWCFLGSFDTHSNSIQKWISGENAKDVRNFLSWNNEAKIAFAAEIEKAVAGGYGEEERVHLEHIIEKNGGELVIDGKTYMRVFFRGDYDEPITKAIIEGIVEDILHNFGLGIGCCGNSEVYDEMYRAKNRLGVI